MNINTSKRPNFKEGSIQMYRYVNGLCIYCGHKHFTGRLIYADKVGCKLESVICSNCNNKGFGFITMFTSKKKKLINRGKRYAERKRKVRKQKRGGKTSL